VLARSPSELNARIEIRRAAEAALFVLARIVRIRLSPERSHDFLRLPQNLENFRPLRRRSARMNCMYHYNPTTALEELTEDATLPNPVHVRDMMLRHKLTADQSLELNRIFVEYQKFFGEAQKLGKEILKRLAA